MAGSPPNLHTMDSRSACIQDVLKVKVKGHVIRALSWILGMSYSVTDGLVMTYVAAYALRKCTSLKTVAHNGWSKVKAGLCNTSHLVNTNNTNTKSEVVFTMPC